MNSESNLPSAERGMFDLDFREVWSAIRRHPILLAACLLIFAGAFGVYSARQAKVYRAVAELLIEPKLPKILGSGFDVEDLGARANAATLFLNTQYKIIQSRAVFHDVIKRLKLFENQEFKAQHGLQKITDRAKFIKAAEGVLRRSLIVQQQGKTRIVRLIVEDFDPNRAALIANTIGQSYIDVSLERRLHSTRQAAQWLDKRVDEFTEEIEGAERDLAVFKESNMLISNSVEDRKMRITSGLNKLNDDLLDIRMKLIELESEQAVIKEATGPGKIGKHLSAIPRVHDSASVQNQSNKLVSLEQTRADLSSRYGTRHPKMLAVNNQIARIQRVREQEVENIVGALSNEIASLKKREVLVRSEMRKQRQKAQSLNTLALEYSKLNRSLGTNQDTYKSLLKRRMETDLSGQLESNFVAFQETAEPRLGPVRPSIPIQTTFGAILGLLLGLGIIVAKVLLDNTIHSQVDVENVLHLAFLGLIPKIEDENANPKEALADGKMPRSRDMFILENPKSAVAECARSLRTNLMFMGAEKPLRRILLTSAGPSEGKSTTVIALGTTMAQAGSRVLIIDTDLRRPRLHKTFGVSGQTGLTSLLLGTSIPSETIKSTEIPGLDILPCGPLPPNPSELLHTEKFAAVLKELEETYDRVILDSPPVNLVTDASILSQLADGTIFVIKASKTTRDAARRAARVLHDVNANVLGVVLNDVDIKQGGYYRDQYYQYYRSGYSYGSDAEGQANA